MKAKLEDLTELVWREGNLVRSEDNSKVNAISRGAPLKGRFEDTLDYLPDQSEKIFKDHIRIDVPKSLGKKFMGF